MKRILLAALIAAAPAVAWAETTMTATPSGKGGKNVLWNGTFDGESARPWSVGFDSPQVGRFAITNHELCLQIAEPGPDRGSVVVRQRPLSVARGHHYQLRLRVHATAATHLRARLSKINAPYTELWAATADVGTDARVLSAAFEGAEDEDNVELAIELGGPLAGATPLTVCLDDVALDDPDAEIPLEKLHPRAIPRVRVNQVGYLPDLPKVATIATAGDAPLAWQLVDGAGKVRASGQTRPFGEDRSSGERVQQIDFSSVKRPGEGFKLRVGADESVPFAIGPDVYRRLKYDALAFFYLQRSGVPIKMPYAGSKAYERPAGHPGDKKVGCPPDAPCSYTLDASGGWYDAGDHGKYVVNGGFTVWMLQNEYETLSRFGTSAATFGDGKMKIPESKNGRPDLLDEARFGLDLFLRLQVPPGQPLAGMVHHKMHGEKWSAIPTSPATDDIKRYLRPPTTAATLNLAAMAAQAARIWRTLDPAFSARCLAAAETAYAAAKKNPHLSVGRDTPGGGAYGDGDLDDEWYWAAAELFITTGKPDYKEDLVRSRYHAPKAGRGDQAGQHRVGPRGDARQDEPAHRAQRPRRRGAGRAAPADPRRRRSPAGHHPQARLPGADGLGDRLRLGVERRRDERGRPPRLRPRADQGCEVRRRRRRLHGLHPGPQPARLQLRVGLRHVRAAKPAPPRLGAPQGSRAPRGAAGRALRRPQLGAAGSVHPSDGDGRLPARDLLRRQHRLVLDQRGGDQLERRACLDGGLSRRHR